MSELPEEISDYLESGWVVVGFSTAMAVAGALVHTVLLQKEAALLAVTVGRNAGKEVGRTVSVLAPRPSQEKR